MKRINAILVLLLVLGMVTESVSPPAACAVSVSGTDSSLQGSSDATSPSTAGRGSLGTAGLTGDPGGAGDGLGATPELQGCAAAKKVGADAVVDFMLQLLRLLQAAG
jgi:hypothetical protein